MASATIKFLCPKCKKKIRVPGQYGGKRGGCPACKEFIDIPPESTLPDGDAAASKSKEPAVAAEGQTTAVTADDLALQPVEAVEPVESFLKDEADAPKDRAKESAKDAAPKAGFIKFACPSCGKPTGFPANMAGTPAACPSCRTRVMVPEENGGESFIVGGGAPAPKPRPKPEAAPVAAEAPAAGGPPWKLIAIAAVVLLAVGIGIAIGLMGKKDGSQTAQAETRTPAPAAPAAPAQPAPAVPPAPVDTKTAPAPAESPKAEPAPAPAPVEAKSEEAPPPLNPPMTPIVETKTLATPQDPGTETPAAPAPEPAKTPGNPEEEDIDLKPAAKKEDPKPADPAAMPDQPPAKAEPKAPAVVCADCGGTGFAPVLPPRPYVRLGTDPMPNPAVSAPWTWCSRCQRTHKNDEILKAEGERLARSMDETKAWSGRLGVQLLYVETKHVSLETMLPPAMAKKTGDALDKLTSHLQTLTRSTVFTQARPSTHKIVICWDSQSYNKLIDFFEKEDPGDHWKLTRQSTGGFGRRLGYFNADRGQGGGPEHMAIYQFANMLIQEATDGKAPPWLKAGFSAYCEKTITNLNLCYAFTYEKNEVQFGQDWDVELKKYAQQGKLKVWEYIFPLSGVGMTALDYLTCYSMVSYFMKSDPRLFQQVILHIKDGMESGKAIEKVYKRPIRDLQMMWAQWAMR
ncbi:MAG: hypothetical protein KIS92_13190 [Planctomycetota bacterium]|nr:hypothetical protein [Planctomycetota bacterium]